MIHLYNSLTQQKEPFTPVNPGKVSIYYCGMTVYDHCHIGHARSWVVFEAFARFLESKDYAVTVVRNITDIDDKIIARANEHGETALAWANRFIQAMHDDEKDLGLRPVQHEPRATEYLQQMIVLIEKLIEKNMAYVTAQGDVCFSVRSYPDYGVLSKRDIDALRKGVRKEVNEDKRDPLDFVLWKLAKPGEPSWPSPWGEGRPGWHIECSAMAGDLLGQPFDIHGGGLDLKFPHHENEIAQSQAAHDCAFAHYWMHIGLVQVGVEKMSKSLGNFITIRDLLNQYDPEVLRYFLMSAHYRSPVTFTPEQIEQSRTGLVRLYSAIKEITPTLPERDATIDGYYARYEEALADDFNTPEAYAVLYDLARTINRLREDPDQQAKAAGYAAHLKVMAGVIGLLQQDAQAFIQGDESDLDLEAIETLVALRKQARADKDWGLADQIRDKLLAMDIVCEDQSDNVRGWRRKGH